MARGRYLFTSEAVAAAHPDKLADQISDGVLDALFAQDPNSRVACETLLTTRLAILAGEITTTAQVDYESVVRDVVRKVGYTADEMGFNADNCEVKVLLHRQSEDIARGVDEDEQKGKPLGAGDQGMMFGYAINHTPELMPLPITLAHRILKRLAAARENREVPWLRPDGKSQVTVEFDGDRPIRIDTVVVAAQHAPEVSNGEIQEFVKEKVVRPVLPPELAGEGIKCLVNQTGRFVIGGPEADCGLTGRKIMVDTYGGWARHGGGAFSGKDPTKVDRSAAYMARHIAKNIVAAGLADRCEIQLAYAIGKPDPVSVLVDTQGTGRVDDARLCEVVRELFPLTPGCIINYLQLRRPIYRLTAAGGHFGRSEPEFTWERTHRVAELRKEVGMGAVP
ncbi:MAG: methionine adenosyltransferase [Thermoguttaceae bacterium]